MGKRGKRSKKQIVEKRLKDQLQMIEANETKLSDTEKWFLSDVKQTDDEPFLCPCYKGNLIMPTYQSHYYTFMPGGGLRKEL
jgi:hypothetical protein